MFVKVIRGNQQRTEVYEPRFIEFNGKDSMHLQGESNPTPEEELVLIDNDGMARSIFLYSKDEVWLSSNTGQTVDRWRI